MLNVSETVLIAPQHQYFKDLLQTLEHIFKEALPTSSEIIYRRVNVAKAQQNGLLAVLHSKIPCATYHIDDQTGYCGMSALLTVYQQHSSKHIFFIKVFL